MDADGPLTAEVLLVGEAPGAKEDDIGRPFVGPAGRDFDKYLALGGLDRSSLRVTNAVKCRPPDNTTPKAANYNPCRTHLAAEIEEMPNLKIIVAVGNVALRTLTGETGIMKKAGQLLPLRSELAEVAPDGVQVYPVIHPAAALHQPSMQGRVRSAFIGLGAHLRQGHKKVLKGWKIRAVRTPGQLRDALQLLPTHGPLVVDVETTGFDPLTEQLVSVAIAIPETKTALVFFTEIHKDGELTEEDLRGLCAELALDYDLMGHNTKYDAKWLWHKCGLPLDAWQWCTQVAAHLLDENNSKSLKVLAMEKLHVGPWADVAYDQLPEEPWENLAKYNALDVIYTWELAEWQKPRLEEEDTLELMEALLMPAVRMYAQIELNGIALDSHEVIEATHELAAAAEEHRQHLLWHCKRLNHPVEDENWNNSNWFRSVMLAVTSGHVYAVTNKGQPSWGKPVLHMMKRKGGDEGHFADHLLKYRAAAKGLQFLTQWEEAKHLDGRLRPNFNMTTTATGRTSSGRNDASEPSLNIQQIPRAQVLRTCFRVPEGRAFIEADYSRIEVRAAGLIYGDLTLPYTDYQEFADELGCTRQEAKAVVLGFLYGQGAVGFQDYARDTFDLIIPLDDAERFQRAFFSKFPGVEVGHEALIQQAHRTGQVYSPFGRIRHLEPFIWGDKEEEIARAERQAINSPVQAFGSDLLVGAASEVFRELHEVDPSARLVSTVHDSLEAECDWARRSDVADFIGRTMAAPHIVKELNVDLQGIPLEVEVRIGKSWGDPAAEERIYV